MSELKVSAPSGGKWRVTFDQTFECENAAGDRSMGKIVSSLVFEFVDGNPRITWQDGPVTDYRKIVKAEPVPTPLVQLRDQVAEGPEATSELPPALLLESQNESVRVIHKVFDLKDLVNCQMDNEWLYGEFCLTKCEGNVAFCRTFGRGILLHGEGLTSVDIEFTGGLHFGWAVSRALDKRRQITFKVSVADPIRLLSVTKGRNGNIHVRVRSQGPLRQEDLHY